LGHEPDLVLHGGGNTSVKTTATNLFGEDEELLYVKGSGGDLATIEAANFSPVRRDTLLKMAELEKLSDAEMVRVQRSAMSDPYAPNPSVEAILHAIIPFRFVDHTHADAVVAITNTLDGEQKVRDIYGERILIVPYVMPGFALARKVYEMTRDADWSSYDGMILLNHGVFTFADDARKSYERMIGIVTQAEEYLAEKDALHVVASDGSSKPDLLTLIKLRQTVSAARSAPVLAVLDDGPEARGFSNLPNVSDIATRGCLTPDHIIRTKRMPLLVEGDPEAAVADYARSYRSYFERWNDGNLTPLDPAPRWAVWSGHGAVALGATTREAGIITDIASHTMRAIQWAEALGGWEALPEEDLFEMEYWELEQAKLKKEPPAAPLQGKIALITGAASGIGKACAEELLEQGACVAALDIKTEVTELFSSRDSLGLVCDVTDTAQLSESVEATVGAFGGLDILVTNAGVFSPSHTIADMDQSDWRSSLELNLNSHQALIQVCIPYLELGWEPSIVVMGSKNVPAPGPGAGAYSVAKAGLTQLARVAALELAKKGIRVNTLHPNAVFDTGIWTEDVLRQRAEHYGLSVEQYKTNNLLGVEVTSRHVARLVCALAGPLFSRTTGAQIPVDGGNERVV